jgi:hypothetical protein
LQARAAAASKMNNRDFFIVKSYNKVEKLYKENTDGAGKSEIDLGKPA